MTISTPTSPTTHTPPSTSTDNNNHERDPNAPTSVLAALKKYELSVGLSYASLPPELCEGSDLRLKAWSLIVGDGCLRRIASGFRDNGDGDGDGLEEGRDGVGGINRKNKMKQTAVLKRNTRRPFDDDDRDQNDGETFQTSSSTKPTPTSTSKTKPKPKLHPIPTQDRTTPTPPQLQLLHLDITGASKVTDHGLHSLATTCTSLRTLTLQSLPLITSVGLRLIALSCPNIRSLNISYCTGILGPGFAVIGQCCHRLTALNLAGCRQVKEYALLSIFTGCALLENLDLMDVVKLSDFEGKALATNCHVLRVLNLSGCKLISDVGILSISQGCVNLEVLNLTRTELHFKITDVSLLALGERLSVLRVLNLSGCTSITDVGLTWLCKGCTGLEHIELSECYRITNGGMQCLGECLKLLTFIGLSGLKNVTDVGLRFVTSGCERLEHLNACGMYLLSDGMKRDFGYEGLQSMCRSPCATTLKSLNLSGCFQVSTVALKSLALLINLDELNLASCTKLSDRGMSSISSSLPKLRTLTLSNCGVCLTDKILGSSLRNFSNLRSITLTNLPLVSVQTLKSLSLCAHLRRVDLTGCTGIDDMCMLTLTSSLYTPGISALYLTGCVNITDVGLSWIADGLRDTHNNVTLVTLSLKGTKCTVSAVKSIRDRYRYSAMRRTQEYFGLWPLERVSDRMVINEYGTVYRSAARIQAVHRGGRDRGIARDRNENRGRVRAAGHVQRFKRGWEGRHVFAMVLTMKMNHDRMAGVIQNMYRAWKARRMLGLKRHARYMRIAGTVSVEVQRMYRGRLGRVKAQNTRKLSMYIIQLKSKASVVMQKIGRRLLARCEYLRRRNERNFQNKTRASKAWTIQLSYRQAFARNRVVNQRTALHTQFLFRRDSATKVQNRYRTYRCRMILKSRLHERHAKAIAAIHLQSIWRARVSWLYVETRRQMHHASMETSACVFIQKTWRMKSSRIRVLLILSDRKLLKVRENGMADVIGNWYKGVKARRTLNGLREQRNRIKSRMSELEYWGSTTISSAYRGKIGRDIARGVVWTKKAKWKEMYSEVESRRFYYNQVTSEIRYRKPQDLLDLMKRPLCSNCEFYEARMECSGCQEFFCSTCWTSVHFGGKRSKHEFRHLYDYYEKRVDYGDDFGEDGENFPSVWPTEIMQDEFSGWRLRVFPSRQPYKIVGDWEVYLNESSGDGGDGNGGGQEFFYHNRNLLISQYEKPSEISGVFNDDLAGAITATGSSNGSGFGSGGGGGSSHSTMMTTQNPNQQQQQQQNQNQNQPTEPVEVMFGGWGKYYDDDRKNFYYFNEDSGESTYRRPENFKTGNDPFKGVIPGGGGA